MPEKEIEFDYSKLLGRIKEKFGTQDNLAAKTTISATSLNYKLNNKVEWKQKEIARLKEEQGITEIEEPTIANIDAGGINDDSIN